VSLPALTTKYGIDAELDVGGRIAGEVTNASTGAPIEEALVCASSPSSEVGGCAITNSAGDYTISGLAAGQYVVELVGAPGSYLVQYYDGSYAAGEAQPVAVTSGETTAGIDAALLPGVFKAPVDLTPLSVSGAAAVGDTLLCVSGSWSANPSPTFAYVWLRDGTPIPLATQATYTIQSADVGQSLTCEVEATSSAGTKRGVGRAISSPLAIGAGAPSGSGAVSASREASSPAIASTVVMLDASKLYVSKHHSVQVRIRCEHARCQGSLELVARTAGRATLAKGAFALAAGQSATVTLRLTRAGVKQLEHARAHHVAARLTALVHAGQTITATTAVS
jgi:hypothetical protein